jgi:S-adenosylmethionine:tRNA ribosyltransferase-isomerase
MVFPWKKFNIWTTIYLTENIKIHIKKISYEGRIIEVEWGNFENILKDYWQMPLPPYIEYTKEKEEPYQPIFASKPWSTASPTASLHFTSNLLEELKKKWITQHYTTLHIWLGTFKIVEVSNIEKYDIHTEITEIEADIWDKIYKAKLKWKILATWTTVTRTLESLPYLYKKIENSLTLSNQVRKFWEWISNNITEKQYDNFIKTVTNQWKEIQFETKLFIYPWFSFKIIDELITNFHLPKSSLLMLVAWFMWHKNMFDCYNFAIQNNYRFFSFGDVMYIR